MIRSLSLFSVAVAALALSVSATRDASAQSVPAVNDAAVLGEEQARPRTLSEYGFFRDASARQPNMGVHAYELNSALWSDGADKLRYIYVPEGKQMITDGDGLLQFPVGSAIIKTFAYGEGDEQRYIETRVLLHRADGWVALPYRWNEEQTEARLALAGGRVPITTPAGEEISYRIPNMNQCKTCHSKDGEVIPIGPKARNLSFSFLYEMSEKEHLEGAMVATWTGDLRAGGPKMPDWRVSDQAGLDARARAYLDVNCAHCHQPGGSASNSGLDLRWEQDDPFAIGIRKPPVAAGRGAGGFNVSIAPGEPDKSILVHRMNSNEPGVAMPELGRSTVDTQAVALMREWIEGMEP